MKGIADTGFIVAFGNRNDHHHGWAVEVAKGITEALLTCEAVLAERRFTWVQALTCSNSCEMRCCDRLSIALATCSP